MKYSFAAVLCVLLFVAACAAASAQATGVPVIFDADIDSDVDDVGALAVLHALADSGEADILGVIATTEDIDAPACVAAINAYYKRPNIPIGANHQARPDASLPKWLYLRSGFSKFTAAIAREFPHDLKSYCQTECATSLYRRLLASQDDNSVVIITVGHLTNLKNLSLSVPDEHSGLYGIDLIRGKVKLWCCVGGRYPSGKEANFYRPDPESTLITVSNWPGMVVFSGWELGNPVKTGGAWFKQNAHKSSPVYRAYELYNNFEGRASWDQTAVLYAIRGTMNDTLWSIQWEGWNHILPDGSNEWRVFPGKKDQGYLAEKMEPAQLAKLLDELMVRRPAL
jgi:inosine-uridine nucleoside N-ribohydrolase